MTLDFFYNNYKLEDINIEKIFIFDNNNVINFDKLIFLGASNSLNFPKTQQCIA